MMILVGGEKGGPGKTTIATNLAAMHVIKNASSDRSTLLVDSDKQSTSSFWGSLRDEDNISPRVPIIQKLGSNLKHELRELNTKYDDIIIDAGGQDSKELRSALLVADIAILPLRASQFDLWTLTKLNNLVDDAKITNENLKAYVLVNAASTHPSVNEHKEVLDFMEDMDQLSLLKSVIKERKVFRRCAMSGMCVTEYPQQDEKASTEMNSLYKEVFEDE